MFAKLQWDIDQFDEIQREMPDMPEPLGFAAINVCISASSLRSWTVAAFIQCRRSEGMRVREEEVVAHIYSHVLQQPMCDDIANTAKHSGFAERHWPGGAVSIDFDEATEDYPGGYVLRHLHQDGQTTSIALNAFAAMERCWWGELQTLGFAFPNHAPEWRRRKIAAVFGGEASSASAGVRLTVLIAYAKVVSVTVGNSPGGRRLVARNGGLGDFRHAFW